MNSYTGKPELTNTASITNDGFWSPLEMDALVMSYRIPSELDNDVIADRLTIAMIEINQKLDPVKALLLPDYSDIELYCTANSNQVGGVEIVIKRYEEAVFSYAKALLLQMIKTMNRKNDSAEPWLESKETENYWIERSNKAIYALFNLFGIIDYSNVGVYVAVI